jgi:hypothetical protein
MAGRKIQGAAPETPFMQNSSKKQDATPVLAIKHIGGAGEEFVAKQRGGITINVRKKADGAPAGVGSLADRLKLGLNSKKPGQKLGLPVNPNRKGINPIAPIAPLNFKLPEKS